MSHFAKRHYEAIASAMQASRPDTKTNLALVDQWSWDCKHLADMFRVDNPRFDRDRFLRACQPGANVRARG